MPTIHNTDIHTVSSVIGSVDLLVSDPFDSYEFIGVHTLTSNYTIGTTSTLTGTDRITYDIFWNAKITLNGNYITVFGQTMPANLVNKEHRITAYWDGVQWDVTFIPDIADENSISSSSVAGVIQTIPIPLSFETGELGKFYINLTDYAPFKLIRGRVETMKLIEATDDATVNTFRADGVTAINSTVTGGSSSAIEIPAGHLPGTLNGFGSVDFDQTITDTSLGGDTQFTFETVKTTPGGKAIMYLTIEKL